MSQRIRLMVFLIGAIGMALLGGSALWHVTEPSPLRDRYLRALDVRTFPERNVTDVVTAVNFDYRGFDTMGEEFILFASVMGSLVLLREETEKKTKPLPDSISPGRGIGPSEAMSLWILVMVAPKLVFGIYVVIHGQLTPGGGFQGGVILASVALIVYLGHNFETFKKIMTHPMIEIAEAVGAAGFILIGMIAWFWGKPFMTNTLPLGKSNELTSGGIIPLISGTIGLEVTAGFVLLLFAFLQNLLTVEEQ